MSIEMYPYTPIGNQSVDFVEGYDIETTETYDVESPKVQRLGG